jgi:hypothetical protein
VNVVTFAWGVWLRPTPVVVASATPEAPRLQLSSEVPPAPKQCVSVGPFADEAAASEAARILLQAGYETRNRDELQRVIEGYWVSLPSPGEGREEQRLLRRLRQGGVADVSPILDPIQGRRVSLGVFSEEERATAQAARASQLGIEAEIAPREREQSVRWLDFELRTDAPGFAESEFQAGSAALKLRPCPTAAPAAQAPAEPPGGGAEAPATAANLDAIADARPAP